jgi:hypothetical protein
MKSLAKTVSLNTQYQAKIAAKYNLQRKLDERYVFFVCCSTHLRQAFLTNLVLISQHFYFLLFTVNSSCHRISDRFTEFFNEKNLLQRIII